MWAIFRMLARHPLCVFDAAECQINSRLDYLGLLGDFMLKMLLRLAGHDKQTPVRQSFRESDGAILPLDETTVRRPS